MSCFWEFKILNVSKISPVLEMKHLASVLRVSKMECLHLGLKEFEK